MSGEGVANTIAGAVDESRRAWLQYASDVEAIAEFLRHEELGGWLAIQLTLGQMRLWRRYLQARFGLKVTYPRPRGIQTRVTRARRRKGDWPAVEVEMERRILSWLVMWSSAYAAAMMAATEATKAGMSIAGANQAVVAEVRRVLMRHPPLLEGVHLTRPLHPYRRSAATISMAGWAATQLTTGPMPSGYRNERLIAALGADSTDVSRALIERLPASVLLAWSERRPGEPLTRGRKSLVNEISRLLEQDRPLATGAAAESSDPRAEDFKLHEEARDELAALIEDAGLAPREGEVLALRLRDFTEREIAARLNVTEGTVKTTVSRVTRKLRRAAGEQASAS